MNETESNNLTPPKKVTPKEQNPLIEARYKLSIDEQKIMFTLLSKLPADSTDFVITVKIRPAELIEACQFDVDKGPGIILNAAKSLRRRLIEIENENNPGQTIITGWIISASFSSGENEEITFFIDGHLKNQLLDLKQNYASAPTGLLMSFRHDYSPKFYAWLKGFPLGKRCTYSLDFFIIHFDLPESYKTNFTHFRRKFFEPCIQEINDISDIGAVYDYVKEGRAFTKINLAVATKHKVKMPRLSEQGQIGEGLTKREKVLLIMLTNPDKWGFTQERAEELLLAYGAPRVRRNMDFVNLNRQGQTNLSDYLIQCIEQDSANPIPEPIPAIPPESAPEPPPSPPIGTPWRGDLLQLKDRLNKARRRRS